MFNTIKIQSKNNIIDETVIKSSTIEQLNVGQRHFKDYRVN